VPAGEVVAQVRRLVEAGYREIVLTGVDMTSYGAGLPGPMSLGRLVKQILKLVPKLDRLRLSSIDQVEADAHLMDAIASEPRLMPYLHLSLQAGNDLILKRMKRRHARADAIRFCTQARELRPDMVFGADLIAGFPTETDEMFEDTVALVDDCGLTYLHVFPFSPRAKTPAARMPQVERGVVKERAARLRAKGDATHSQFLARHRDAEIEILMERGGVGRTPHFAEVAVDGGSEAGALHLARIDGHDGRRLKGRVVA
jgi:threonylcarbamoyladenosine tRNA methylthiotransferase MtaB